MEVRTCAVCGQEFKVNLRAFGSKAKTCGKLFCHDELDRDNKRKIRKYQH